MVSRLRPLSVVAAALIIATVLQGQREAELASEPELALEPDIERQKRRRCLMVCGHCDRALPKSTYYRHKRLFFNHVSGTLLRDSDASQKNLASSLTPETTFSNAMDTESPSGSYM